MIPSSQHFTGFEMNKFLALLFIAFVTGMAANDVGRMPPEPTGTYPWWLPLLIFLIMAIPSLCAYLAGREDQAKDFEEGRL